MQKRKINNREKYILNKINIFKKEVEILMCVNDMKLIIGAWYMIKTSSVKSKYFLKKKCFIVIAVE